MTDTLKAPFCRAIAVAGDFLFIAIFQRRMAKDNGSDSRLVNLDPLDTVRRYGTLRDGVFSECLQALGRLPRKQFLKPWALPISDKYHDTDMGICRRRS